MYSLELGRAGYIIAKDMCKVQPGESVLITVDSVNDFAPVEAVAQAAEALGAKVTVAWHSTPAGYGKVADERMSESLKAAIPAADVWIEFNNQWLLYSTPWVEAMNNGKTRYLFLGGLDRAQVTRCIANLDMDLQRQFQNTVVELSRKAKKTRVTSPAGTDVSFENDPKRPILNELGADTPGAHFLIGQIGWAPIEHTINGKIVFDGSFSGGGEAELGVLKNPVELIVEAGRIVDIKGKEEAKFIARWLGSFDDPHMYNMAHFSYGFNPGSKLCGLCTEDERVWGATEWGIGYQGPMFEGGLGDAATHADGICLNSTVWLDDEKLTENGRVIHPLLAPIARAMGK
jgi:2,5-dihydroxypyridine 5,6-dioxygenase